MIHQKSLFLILKKTLLGKCPHCGSGKLYHSFLKTVNSCSVCHENFTDIRADDAPAWLTILIVGHLLVPVLFFVLPMFNYPDWALSLIIIIPMLILCLLILPFAKSLFIGILWHQKNNHTD